MSTKRVSKEITKIEDVEYTDLLTVYDHLNGGITYVYPVWIKQEEIVSVYEEITELKEEAIKLADALYDCVRKLKDVESED